MMHNDASLIVPPRFWTIAAAGLILALLIVVPPRPARAQSASAALDALVAAYPHALVRHDDHYIYWRDGTRMPVPNGRPHKSFEALLRDASILYQFRMPYPRGQLKRPPSVNDDPGRLRNEAFFNKLYGDCRRGRCGAI
jgi:hypothetical protein